MLKNIFSKDNMGAGYFKIVKRLAGIFVITVIAFVLLLTIVMCIPNSLIKENYDMSVAVFEEEGDGWNRTFNSASGSMLDNLTDSIIISETYANEKCSPFNNALSNEGYSRYWHGYLVWVRPMLIFFSYLDIRYILMFVLMFMFVLSVLGINDRLGRKNALAFTFCMTLAYFIMVPWSLQFCEVFLIMMAAIIFIVKKYNSDWKVYTVGELFLLIGMITQYLDFLTAPLLTLGMPLCVILLINIYEKNEASILKNWAILIHSSVTWAVGWGVGWMAKWVIATIVLGRNVILDAMNQAAFRVNGNETSSVSRISTVVKNVYSMIPFSSVIGKKEIAAIALVGVLYVLIFAFVIYKLVKSYKKKSLHIYIPVLMVSLMPIAWFIVMAQHSFMHFFYTYRIQMMSYFALITSFVGMVNWRTK